MVELQIVILAVAGSSPVGHPIFKRSAGRVRYVKAHPDTTRAESFISACSSTG